MHLRMRLAGKVASSRAKRRSRFTSRASKVVDMGCFTGLVKYSNHFNQSRVI